MSQVLGKTRLAYSRAWHIVDVGASLPRTKSSATAATTTPLISQTQTSTPRPLGRLASQIALTLMGKHKPMYNPSTDCGDYVVAVGCHELHVTGKKRQQKTYYSHTTRPGSLKQMSLEQLMAKWGGGEILRRAVRGMLPKNRLRDKRMHRLKTFEGLAHPYKENVIRFAADESLLDHPQVVKEMRLARHEQRGKIVKEDGIIEEKQTDSSTVSS